MITYSVFNIKELLDSGYDSEVILLTLGLNEYPFLVKC